MKNEYLRRVVVFLQQDLPEYKEMITVADGCIVFEVYPDSEFEPFYQVLFPSILRCARQIRNTEYDLEFRIWSPGQERRFKILK